MDFPAINLTFSAELTSHLADDRIHSKHEQYLFDDRKTARDNKATNDGFCTEHVA